MKTIPKAWNETPPGLTTYCFHGNNVPTAEVLHYNDDFPDTMPTIEKGDGDGTVNIRSLEACKRWIGKDPKTDVKYQILEGATHNGILEKVELLKAIQKLLINN